MNPQELIEQEETTEVGIVNYRRQYIELTGKSCLFPSSDPKADCPEHFRLGYVQWLESQLAKKEKDVRLFKTCFSDMNKANLALMLEIETLTRQLKRTE